MIRSICNIIVFFIINYGFFLKLELNKFNLILFYDFNLVKYIMVCLLVFLIYLELIL